MALTNAVQEANDIFSQAGVEIVMREPVVIKLEEMLMHVANEYNQYAWSAKKFDVHARDLWPMYATSSNRLDYINMHLADDMPSKVSNYFANARSELLALPPGTMQMLPTNQFYNVED